MNLNCNNNYNNLNENIKFCNLQWNWLVIPTSSIEYCITKPKNIDNITVLLVLCLNFVLIWMLNAINTGERLWLHKHVVSVLCGFGQKKNGPISQKRFLPGVTFSVAIMIYASGMEVVHNFFKKTVTNPLQLKQTETVVELWISWLRFQEWLNYTKL